MSLLIPRGARLAVLLSDGAGPAARFAADEVRRCLRVTLDFQDAAAAEQADFAIELRRGRPAASDAAWETFPRSGPAGVVILGPDDGALRDGAFAFLRRAVGARWVYPGPDGEFIPRLDRLALDEMPWFAPAGLPYRGLHICAGSDHYDPDVAVWMARLGANRKVTHHREVDVVGQDLERLGIQPDTMAHSFSFWIPDAEFHASHPGFFALVGGRRIRHADGGQLCLANREMAVVFVDRVRAFALSHPTVPLLGITPNDGYGWCECADCRALDARLSDTPGDVSGRVWRFSADVASALKRSLPGRLIVQSVYSNFRALPDFEMPDNLAIGYAVAGRCFRHSLGDPACPVNDAHRREILRWRSRFRHVYLYEYYFSSSWRDLPFPVWRTAAEDMEWLRRSGLDGFLTEVVAADHDWWDAAHLAVAAALEGLRQPGSDAGAWLADVCRARFGPAARPMLGYFVALEERVMSRDACFFQADARRLAAFLDPRLRETCRQRLAEADAALADAEARCVAEVGREARLFRKWVRIAETLETMPSPGPLTARPFPGWERALAPHESSADAVPLTTRAYLIPSEKGRTDLRVYADGDAVCFAFECFEPAMDRLSVRTREDSLNVYGDDGVEIFLAAQQGTPRCAHFLANADGFKIASDCDIPGRRWNWAWHPRWEVRARRHPDRWTLVARISLADVGGAAEVFFTVVRNRVVGGLLDISGFPDGGAFFNTAAYHPLRIGPATAP